MVYKRFIIGVILRLALLVLALGSLVYIVLSHQWIVSIVVLVVVNTAVLFELFQFVTKTNKDLAKFIDAINYKDYSVSFSSYKLGTAFDELHDSFRKTLQLFRELKLEKEAHYQYMLQLVKHVNVGIVAVDENDKLVLYNNQAAALLELPNLVYWERYMDKVPHLYEAVRGQRSSASQLIKLKNRDLELNLRVNRLKVENDEHLIIIFQNIKAEIDEKEIDAWNRLIKILTHEIMNSVTPISSLASTLIQLEVQRSTDDNDVLTGLQTIERRSKTLLKFVDDYRKLASIPAPVLKPMDLADFLGHLEELYAPELNQSNIAINIQKPSFEAQIKADEGLLNQVFANLMSNSMHALSDSIEAEISIHCELALDALNIYFTDNGEGISASKLGEVFVPFYSSKTTGSGIGLSLCKQIMHLHGGSITAKSAQGKTTFILGFDFNRKDA